MKKALIFFSLLSMNAFADIAFVGDYQKVKGTAECPDGEVQFLIQAEDKERILLFGARKSWTLSLLDKDQTSEKVEEGCSYDYNYELKEGREFRMTTTRTGCPAESENGVVYDELKLVKNELTLYSSFKPNLSTAKEEKLFCRYTKKKK